MSKRVLINIFKSVYFLILVLGLASQVSAQPQICSLQGTVVDESNGLPIPIALITAQGTSITTAETTTTPLGTMETITTVTTITGTTTTDINGDYCFGNLPGGTYEVTADAMGYIPETAADVVIVPGGTATQDFSLSLAEEVTIKFEPETLNTNNKGSGSVVTVKVYPPAGYSADDIVPDSVIIADIGGNTTNIGPIKWTIEDGHSVFKAKYSRQEILDVIRASQLTGDVEITITGLLKDGTGFIGSDSTTVKNKK